MSGQRHANLERTLWALIRNALEDVLVGLFRGRESR